ncbi:hypothetical protein SAMN04488540_10478 [Ferrimonas sediminum]|uniref:Uncharacterized protein n=1 Tax=Ferrimonas sediminum TaxID=718193 RepID=A0A1G8PTJ9_9GAMM|nr:hypothetical protein [Ferrimonas sediminum]SDI95869.1 hypothetical protein SAMN04488540_10478 [Ferrimonas sediminum]
MKRHKTNAITRTLGIALVGTAGLYCLVSPTTARADFFPQQLNQACMAEAAGFNLNCTANDIQVSQVTNITRPDGSPGPVECTLGGDAEFRADVTIVTTAKRRYDYTVYLPEGNWSPQEFNTSNTCSVLVGQDFTAPGEDLEDPGDMCADISKPPGSHLYTQQLITLNCVDEDQDGRAEFRYCAAWDNKADSTPVCDGTAATTPVPGTPSKCRCDEFNIDVFIKPDPPTINKSEGSPITRPEPGGDYTFTASFTNNSLTSIFIDSVADEIDVGGEGSFDVSLDLLNGATQTVDPTNTATAEGVYLKSLSASCAQPADIGNGAGELVSGATYSCTFTVTIVDRDLPNDQSPELYKDVIKVALTDKNGNPVVNGATCPADLSPIAGDHCSVLRTVDVTNLPPSITVSKTPSPDQVLEPGGDVTFDIVVTSTSGNYDDPLTLTSLMDTVFGDLNGVGTCATGGSFSLAAPYSCSFTETISGNAGDVHNNTVTAKATDNENDEAQNSDGATVNINDVPSIITLVKTADPIEVDETGDDPTVFRDVDFTFEFSVDAAGVDDVTFNSLTDTIFGTLTGECLVDTKNGSPIGSTPLSGFVLQPGEDASCTITKALQGDAGDVHNNVATIKGIDEDAQPVMDSDDATVTFLDTGLDMEQEFAAKMIAFVRITNGNVDTASITGVTIKGVNLVAGGGIPGQFEVQNDAGTSSYNPGDGPYAFCSTGVDILPGDTYECAFTLKLFPGFPPGDINFSATGANGLVFTYQDNEGNSVTTNVDMNVMTIE